MKFGFLTPKEKKIFDKLDTAIKVQDFLDKVPINFEKTRETLLSPRKVLERKRAHCMEGALFAAAVFWYHGAKPLLLDLRTTKDDFDHVVALFKQNGKWGAISKSNHGVLLYRDPIYSSVRELAISYFHEYFLQNRKKTLREFSEPFDLRKFGTGWIVSDKDLWYIDKALDRSPHHPLLDKKSLANLRLADRIQIRAGNLEIYKP